MLLTIPGRTPGEDFGEVSRLDGNTVPGDIGEGVPLVLLYGWLKYDGRAKRNGDRGVNGTCSADSRGLAGLSRGVGID